MLKIETKPVIMPGERGGSKPKINNEWGQDCQYVSEQVAAL